MARKNLILSDNCVYHVTNRSNNREWFYIPADQVWDTFCETLNLASAKYETEIHTFVLMSNHYHLVLATRQTNINHFMRYFQTEVCREIQRHCGRINHIFGNRYKWSVLWNSFSYAVTTKYVLRNPVKAGITSVVEDYAYSSIHPKATDKLSLLDRIDPIAGQIPRNPIERLKWLNTPTTKETDELVRKGLRRFEFSLSSRKSPKIHEELVSLGYKVTMEDLHPIPF